MEQVVMGKQQMRQRNSGFLAFFISGICVISSGIVVSLLQEMYGFEYGMTGTLLSLMSIGNLISGFVTGDAVILLTGNCKGLYLKYLYDPGGRQQRKPHEGHEHYAQLLCDRRFAVSVFCGICGEKGIAGAVIYPGGSRTVHVADLSVSADGRKKKDQREDYRLELFEE